ncbi:MAG TPA: YbaK/EbsC family protein [Anaerolineales bacterium]|nr:YbaK/EbsC family protein [Anaerolineales bacterium]
MDNSSTSLSASQPPASIALDLLGIPHRVFRHEKPVRSFEEAAIARNQRPEQIVRSILFQVRPGEFTMVLMAGPDQVDWKKLRGIVKRSRVRMATEDEVLEVTGYRIGTVSPFGLKNQVRVLLDASALKEDEISIGSGVRNMAIIIKSSDARKALGDVEIVELGKPNPS